MGMTGIVCAIQVSLGEYNTKQYCDNIDLSTLSSVQQQGSYHQFSIPISSFHCGFAQSSITQVSLQSKSICSQH